VKGPEERRQGERRPGERIPGKRRPGERRPREWRQGERRPGERTRREEIRREETVCLKRCTNTVGVLVVYMKTNNRCVCWRGRRDNCGGGVVGGEWEQLCCRGNSC